MKDWFEALEARERTFVMIGACALALALVYAMVWQPLAKKHSDMKADVLVWQQSLAELKPLRGGASQPGASTGSTDSQSPLMVVDRTLVSHELDRYRQSSQPTTSNGIRVVFENIAFDELIVWLGDVGDAHGMHVQAGNFAAGRQEAEGRINATLTLERAP